ncbi:MAG: hypothetical protein CL760_11930 [Chloroflexi bacterium]|nr:hypothetical protein [Chloroflexota bacterium]|tara:strand:+ start:49176 stop:49820 length:645 start_codon:yes stop_codon:yes gene_type:complete
MNKAAIISNFHPANSEHFAEDYVYQQIVIQKILKDRELPYIPLSYENNFTTIMNDLKPEQYAEFNQLLHNLKLDTEHLIVAIDRGFTAEMESLLLDFIEKNPKGHIKAFSIYLHSNSHIHRFIDTFNKDDSCVGVRRVQVLKKICNQLLKENMMNYQTASDMSGYRRNYAMTVANAEKLVMKSFLPVLDKKIRRDMKMISPTHLNELFDKWNAA